MADPSRRPSNQRVRTAALDATVWIECADCLGDGWTAPPASHRMKKLRCAACGGAGRRETLAIYRRPGQRILSAPAGR